MPDKEHLLREKRKANGHKSNCTCHICENIKNKIRKGGYEKDALKEQMKRGGYHKPNGHTPHCKCIICKNMTKKRRQRGGDIEDQIEASNRGEKMASMDDVDYDALERGEIPNAEDYHSSATDLANDNISVIRRKNVAKSYNTIHSSEDTNKMPYKDKQRLFSTDPLDAVEKGERNRSSGGKRTRRRTHRRRGGRRSMRRF